MVAAVEIADFLRREFPQTRCVVEAVGDGTSTVSHEITVHELRPGGTVSGPVLMSVADIALSPFSASWASSRLLLRPASLSTSSASPPPIAPSSGIAIC